MIRESNELPKRPRRRRCSQALFEDFLRRAHDSTLPKASQLIIWQHLIHELATDGFAIGHRRPSLPMPSEISVVACGVLRQLRSDVVELSREPLWSRKRHVGDQ